MRNHWVWLAVTALFTAATFVNAPFPDELKLQHFPTVAIILGMGWSCKYFRLADLSFFSLLAFLWAHILGARYIYSFVPYDAWAMAIVGDSISERFGWERNHYDRFVHLLSGLCIVPVACELLQRLGGMRPAGSALVSISVVLSLGALYEIGEWQLAMNVSPAQAEAYNGQQGDVWDPQKDLAMALTGSIISSSFFFRRRYTSVPSILATSLATEPVHFPLSSSRDPRSSTQQPTMFITLDGIDGAGKSSQVAMLCEHLEGTGSKVLRVRDPGGTSAGEAIRSILLNADFSIHRRCEALLFLAARSQLVEEQIKPALQAGTVVVSDRFLLANVVYQSIGSDLHPDELWRIGEWASGGLRPDLTLLLDMPAEKAMTRLDRPKDRMESRGLDYLEAVRLGFLVQLPRAAHHTAIINADRSIQEIHNDIVLAVREASQ